MRYVFPCDIVVDQEELRETGRKAFNVTFPDVYGANTFGWSWEEAVEMAEECLGVALGMYVTAGEELPAPGLVSEGQVPIPVPPVVAAKLSLYSAIRRLGLSACELADMLQISSDAVKKLLDPGYRSHLTQLENALHTLGYTLVIEDAVRIPLESSSAAALSSRNRLPQQGKGS